MWTFGHSVNEIERSAHHVVIMETATSGVAAIFGAFAVMSLFVYRSVPGLAITLFFACAASYSGVNSSFIADRNHRTLVIRRQLWRWTFEKVYPAKTVDRVYVRHTIRGSGLAVRFTSGRSKDLSMNFDTTAGLDHGAAALNHFLYTSHRG
jgi:hypothetical protein